MFSPVLVLALISNRLSSREEHVLLLSREEAPLPLVSRGYPVPIGSYPERIPEPLPFASCGYPVPRVSRNRPKRISPECLSCRDRARPDCLPSRCRSRPDFLPCRIDFSTNNMLRQNGHLSLEMMGKALANPLHKAFSSGDDIAKYCSLLLVTRR